MKTPGIYALAGTIVSLSLLSACTNNQQAENYVPLSEVLGKTASGSGIGQPVDGNGEAAKPLTGTVKLNPAHGQPGHRCDIPDGAPLPIEQATEPAATPQPAQFTAPVKSEGSVALNPEHGKPGHRCDIAVGAPLNSKPATNAEPVVTSSNISANSSSSKAVSGLNPEHGKPGHRCDIAVGAPLNSKPPTTTSPSSAVATSTPAKVAPGMNPAHGEPGHRCDIAVGAPLNPEKKDNVIQVKTDASKDSSN